MILWYIHLKSLATRLFVCATACSNWHHGTHQSAALLALCEWNPPVTGEFNPYGASNVERVSITWRHQVMIRIGGLMRFPIAYWNCTIHYREAMSHEYVNNVSNCVLIIQWVNEFHPPVTSAPSSNEATCSSLPLTTDVCHEETI